MAKLNKIAVTFPTKIGASEEKALAKIYTALEKAWSDVAGLLSDVRKTTPMPKDLDDDLTKRETISKGRKAELKDLEKADKKGELHTNPSKLQRLYKDLNEDIAQANWLEGGVDNAVDAHFALDIVKLLAEAKADLPKGVTAGAVDLAEMGKQFTAAGIRSRWKSHTADRKAFLAEVAEKGRVAGIKNLRDLADIKALKQGKRDSLIDAGVKSKAKSPDDIEAELKAALVTQDKPDKSRWANYLGLGAGGSYRMVKSGKYQGFDIHWTMSNDSWSAATDGGVSISGNSAADILKKLLNVKVGLQLHATLEIGAMSAYPHVFFFGGIHDPQGKWVLAGRDAQWIAAAQAALKKVLDDLRSDILAKINAAIKVGGANF